jgi:hypothetical protein
MPYELNDSVGFEENLVLFGEEMKRLDPKLGPVLLARIGQLATAREREGVLDELLAALEEGEQQ